MSHNIHYVYGKIKKLLKIKWLDFINVLHIIFNSVKSISYGGFKNDRLTTA